MKKMFYAAFMAFVMFGLGSCSNKMDLTGTTWIGNHSMEFDDIEEDVHFDVTTTLEFASATEGTMKFEIFGQTDDQAFTYTCDGKGNGVITGIDEADGSPMESKFNVKDNKLTIVEGDDTYEFVKQ